MRPAALIATLLFAAPALAAPASEADVRALLHAPDARLPTAADWRRLGDDVETRLATLALDPKLLQGPRARALAGLAALAGPVALVTLRSILADPKLSNDLRATALAAYAKAAPTPDTADVLARARPLLDDPDPLLRRAAARALESRRSPDAAAALRARLGLERRKDVVSALRRALTACTEPAPTP